MQNRSILLATAAESKSTLAYPYQEGRPKRAETPASYGQKRAEGITEATKSATPDEYPDILTGWFDKTVQAALSSVYQA